MKLTIEEYDKGINPNTKLPYVGRYIRFSIDGRVFHSQFMSVKTGWEDGDSLYNYLNLDIKRIVGRDVSFDKIQLNKIMECFTKSIRVDNIKTSPKELDLLWR